MNHPSAPAVGLPTRAPQSSNLLSLAQRLWRGSSTLTLWGAALLLALLPLALALVIDDRSLRGVSVWAKPIKFFVSTALLAWTTAFFMALLPAARLQSRALRAIVVLQLLAAGFELAYITWQAAHGQPSHFYTSDHFHAAMFALMGVGAVALTATQAMLAWQVHRSPQPGIAPAYKLAVVLGLALSFVLGSLAGAVLSGRQPPPGGTLPVFGWALSGGDLRPAHFLGLHAAQLLPAFGWLVARRQPEAGRAAVWLGAALYTALFAIAFMRGLS